MQNQPGTPKNVPDKAVEQGESSFKSAKDTADHFKSNVKDLAGKAEDVAANASQKISHAAQCVATEIRRKPVRYAIVGVGIGILGTLWCRRAA